MVSCSCWARLELTDLKKALEMMLGAWVRLVEVMGRDASLW